MPDREWREAVHRGYAWLSDKFADESFLGSDMCDVNWLAKLPLTFAACGGRARARRMLSRARALLDEGTLHSPHETAWTNAVSYALGWLVTGARSSEDYESARILYGELLRYVCPATGGLAADPVLHDKRPYFDVAIQGAVLHAAAAVGDLETARRNASFLRKWFDDQPDPSTFLYTYYRADEGYLFEVPDGEETRYRFSMVEARQPWANLGFALQGLLRLSMATGDQSYRRLSRQIVELLLSRASEDLLGHSQNHKVGHACAMLYALTLETKFRDAAIVIASKIAENILSDGRAWADVYADRIEEQTDYFTVRTTCDSVLWLASICDLFESGSP